MFEKFFLNLHKFEASSIFQDNPFLWSPLKKIEPFILEKVLDSKIKSSFPHGIEIQSLSDSEDQPLKFILITKYQKLQKPFVSEEMKIFIDEGVILEPTAIIKPHTYIGKGSEVRQGAYIRGNVIVGKHSVIGHTTEIKNSIMMDHSEAGHFSYVGDSIIGSYVNLGAGVKLANLQFRSKEEKTDGFIRKIRVIINNEEINTEMEKLGAIIGDFVEIGCNSVTCPGTFLEKNVRIFPGTNLPKGSYKENSYIKPGRNPLNIR